MRESEKLAFRSTAQLKNVGRCPHCGARCELPCRACNHPRRKADELLALVRRIQHKARADGVEL